MELSYNDAVEQLRVAAQLRYETFPELLIMQDELKSALTHLECIETAYAEAGQIVADFQAKWFRKRDDILREIDEIDQLLQPVYQRLTQAQLRQKVARDRGWRNDVHKHQAAIDNDTAKAEELEWEIGERQYALGLIDTSFTEIYHSLARIRRARKAARTRLYRARRALNTRLDAIDNAPEHSQSKQRQLQYKVIIDRAEIPAKFQGNVKIVVKQDGMTHLYFGGMHTPAGQSHGHYVLDATGLKVYARDPFEPHSPHNYLSPKQQEGINPTPS